MFPRELLVTRRRGNRIAPAWADLDAETLATARGLIALYASHVGRRKGDLDRALAQVEEDAGTGFKLHRGLATLLARRSHFEVPSRVDPARVRRLAFEAANRRGPVTSSATRDAVLAEAGASLGLTPDEVEAAMQADREENLVLVAFDAPDPRQLLEAYNLGLAQTLLFDAVRMEVEVTRNVNVLYRAMKRQGLMHLVTRREDGTFVIVVDGPTALFRNTRRYGTSLAKVLPAMLACGPWRLRATVLSNPAYGRSEELSFDLSSDFEGIGSHDDEPPSFDSVAESEFAEACGALRGGWRLLREPALLPAGDSVIIPDFGLAWGAEAPKVFVEIVGFWTPEYLARKVEKMRQVEAEDADLLLLVDEALGCTLETFKDAPAEVVLYKGRVPLLPLTRVLQRHEAARVEADLRKLQRAGPAWTEDVIPVAEAARRLGVQPAAVEHGLRDGAFPGYEQVGDVLATASGLARLATALPSEGPLRDLEQILAAEGVKDSSSLLARLGYTVRWRGLDPGNALATRAPPSSSAVPKRE